MDDNLNKQPIPHGIITPLKWFYNAKPLIFGEFQEKPNSI